MPGAGRLFGMIGKAKLMGAAESTLRGVDDFALKLGRRGGGVGPSAYGAMRSRGYKRMVYGGAGLGIGGAGGYAVHRRRSTATRGLQPRSSGGM